jgi:hypothetical protein
MKLVNTFSFFPLMFATGMIQNHWSRGLANEYIKLWSLWYSACIIYTVASPIRNRGACFPIPINQYVWSGMQMSSISDRRWYIPLIMSIGRRNYLHILHMNNGPNEISMIGQKTECKGQTLLTKSAPISHWRVYMNWYSIIFGAFDICVKSCT